LPNEQKLRLKHGISLIKNEFYGSDNQAEADKEREIFKLPVPQHAPEFKFDKNLVS